MAASATTVFAMGYGALGLGAVSVIAYSIWAYRPIENEITLYAAVAAIYMGFSGVVLSRLMIASDATRFVGLFAVAFLVYAIAWCAAHGLGFRAGAGYLVHRCQEPLKLRLRSAAPR